MLGYDRATEGWADEQWRARARELNGLANKAHHDDALTQQDVQRAVAIAAAFSRKYGHSAAGSGHVDEAGQRGDLVARQFNAVDLEGAERAARQRMNLEPLDPDPLQDLCEIYEATSRWEDMLAAARRWQRLDPQDWRPVARIAEGSYELGRWDNAVNGYHDWARHTPAEPRPWELMWIAANRGGDRAAQLSAAAGWVAADADNADAWASYASALTDAGKHQEALETAQRSLALDAKVGLALRSYADALGGLGRWEEATRAYRRCCDLDPDNGGAWGCLWAAAAHHRDDAVRLEAAARWSAATPDTPGALEAYADELGRAGRYEEAIEIAERAMALSPGSLVNENRLLGHYGANLTLAGRLDRLAVFIDRWPDSSDPTVMAVKALGLRRLDRHSDAAEVAARVCAADSSISDAWQIQAMSLRDLGKHNEEADVAEQWVALEPHNAFARAILARALHDAGRWERLLSVLDDDGPESADPYVLTRKAAALGGLGRHADAVAVAARALELHQDAELTGRAAPDLPFPLGALRTQAISLFELGHFDGAAAAARNLLRREVENAFYWFLLTRSLIAAEQWDDALEAAEQWIALDPSASAWSRKVQALLGLKRWAEARAGAELLLTLRPGDPNALSLASTASAGCGDIEGGIRYAEQWAAADLDSPEVPDWLEQLRELRAAAHDPPPDQA